MYLLSRQEKNCDVSDLPPELLHIILSFLPYDDITAFSMTSPKYLTFLTDDVFWRNKIHNEFPSYYANYIMAKPKNSCEFYFAQPLPTMNSQYRETYLFLLCFSLVNLNRRIKRIGRGAERYLAIDECIYRGVECRDFRLVDYFTNLNVKSPMTDRLEKAVTLALTNGDFNMSLLAQADDHIIIKGLVAGGHLELLQHLACVDGSTSNILGKLISYRHAFKNGHLSLINTFASSFFWSDVHPFRQEGLATYAQRRCWKKACQGAHEEIISRLLKGPISVVCLHTMITGAVMGDQYTLFMRLRENHSFSNHELMAWANLALSYGWRDFSRHICDELKIPEYTLSLQSAVKGGCPDLVRTILRHQAIHRRDYLSILTEAFSARQHIEEIVTILMKSYGVRFREELMVDSDVSAHLQNALKHGDVLMFNLIMDDSYNSSWEWRNGETLDSRVQCCDLFTAPDILNAILKYGSPYLLDRYLFAYRRLCPGKALPNLTTIIFGLIHRHQLSLLQRLMGEGLDKNAPDLILLESAFTDATYHDRPVIFKWLLDYYGVPNHILRLSIARHIIRNNRENIFEIYMTSIGGEFSAFELSIIAHDLLEKSDYHAIEMTRCLSKYRHPPEKRRHNIKRKRNSDEEGEPKRTCKR